MASSSAWRAVASRTGLPLAAAFISGGGGRFTRCEQSASSASTTEDSSPSPPSSSNEQAAGFRPHEKGDFHGMFPRRQLWYPKYPYPLWDKNWDGREPVATGDKDKDRDQMRQIQKTGVTRHIILIRHGQYDETFKEDEKRKLTPLGRKQADYTGKRIAEMIQGAQDAGFGPCRVKVLRVSNLMRAKETATIIASHLPDVEFVDPDPKINEGRPCHHIPGVRASSKTVDLTDDNHPRIEESFRKHFFRSDTRIAREEIKENPEIQHEFEIIVCHANVIRYFLCRALQLPPEAWLRFCPFNCSLTYITIRPTGSVSCRMLGDIGHLPYDTATFSKHHGFNW